MLKKDTECFESLSMNGFFNHFKLLSVRSFDKLRTGSEPVEGLRENFFRNLLDKRLSK